jgi:hypothetical protein
MGVTAGDLAPDVDFAEELVHRRGLEGASEALVRWTSRRRPNPEAGGVCHDKEVESLKVQQED